MSRPGLAPILGTLSASCFLIWWISTKTEWCLYSDIVVQTWSKAWEWQRYRTSAAVCGKWGHQQSESSGRHYQQVEDMCNTLQPRCAGKTASEVLSGRPRPPPACHHSSCFPPAGTPLCACCTGCWSRGVHRRTLGRFKCPAVGTMGCHLESDWDAGPCRRSVSWDEQGLFVLHYFKHCRAEDAVEAHPTGWSEHSKRQCL